MFVMQQEQHVIQVVMRLRSVMMVVVVLVTRQEKLVKRDVLELSLVKTHVTICPKNVKTDVMTHSLTKVVQIVVTKCHLIVKQGLTRCIMDVLMLVVI